MVDTEIGFLLRANDSREYRLRYVLCQANTRRVVFYFDGPPMLSETVGLGRGFARSCTLGRTLSHSRRKTVADTNRNATASKK
jgi:hypothetical protein